MAALTDEFQRAFSLALQDLMGDQVDTLLSAKLVPEHLDWKKGLVPHPGLVRWTMEQYIAKVGINGHLIPALLDSGGEKTMIDVALCKAIGLQY